MRAVEALLTDDEYAELDPEELARIVPAMGIDAAEKEARLFAAKHCVPMWEGLAATWFKARKGKRKAPPTADPIRAASEQPANLPVEDVRPPEAAPPARDMRRAWNGWEPGIRQRTCERCHGRYEGSTRSISCADCAYAGRGTK